MARKKKTKVDASGGGFGGSFGDLLKAQGLVSADAQPGAVAPAPEPEPAAKIAELGKIRLRFEKKGRRGKTVTVIDGLAPLGDALGAVVKRLKKAIGAGATVEGEAVVVQGDQRDRVAAWLKSQGARDVR